MKESPYIYFYSDDKRACISVRTNKWNRSLEKSDLGVDFSYHPSHLYCEDKGVYVVFQILDFVGDNAGVWQGTCRAAMSMESAMLGKRLGLSHPPCAWI